MATCLDFTEIAKPFKAARERAHPSSIQKGRGPSAVREDLDAFEKFAQEFFAVVYKARIVDQAARGQDGGRDLIVEVDVGGKIERWLVSCKHNAHSLKRTVGGDREPSPLSRLQRFRCKRFVGFYSTGVTRALTNYFADTFRGRRSVSWELITDNEIERGLVNTKSADVWLLVARYFPRSFPNLFRRFVIPVAHYNDDDLVWDQGRGAVRLAGLGGGLAYFDPSDAASIEEAKERLLSSGNEIMTSVAHSAFFREAVLDATKMYPRCWTIPEWATREDVELADVSPAWDCNEVFSIAQKNIPTVNAIFAIWTLWNADRAIRSYQRLRAVVSGLSTTRMDVRHGERFDEIEARLMQMMGQGFGEYKANYGYLFSIGSVAQFSDNSLRDLFARLVAFAPPGMPIRTFGQQYTKASQWRGVQPELQTLIRRSVDLLDENAQAVHRKRIRHSQDFAAELDSFCSLYGSTRTVELLEASVPSMRNSWLVPI
jgi:hypothetical protein